jgi:serine/threonine-protein kinase
VSALPDREQELVSAESRTIGRYRILRQLGVGGMGEVYLADDPLLGRQVALKRPSQAWMTDPDAVVRLRREARAVARLTHPNIAAVYDLIETDEGAYVVMEYVEGGTLADRPANQALPLARVLDIGIQLAGALAEAHAHGIVHRDLKPANVSVSPTGRVKVLDFGISKSRQPVDGDGPTLERHTLTDPGRMMGTPGYAPPEQLLGRPTDARADVYALGVILYELASGRRAFAGHDTMAVALVSLTEPVPALAQVAPGAGPELSSIVARATAREPGERHASASSLLEELARLRDALNAGAAVGTQSWPTELAEAVTMPPGSSARSEPPVPKSPPATPGPAAPPSRRRAPRLIAMIAGGVVLVSLTAGGLLLRSRSDDEVARVSPATGVVRVAILPPVNLSGRAENDVIGAGIADSLFNDLVALSAVAVVPRAEVRRYTAPDRDALAAARTLGASHVVDASVQRAGETVRVNARLLSSDGTVIWKDALEQPLSSIFDLQRRLSEAIVGGLPLRLSESERDRLARPSTTNISALEAYWRGRTLLEQADDPERLSGAIAAFEQAGSLDSGFADAFAGLGEACWERYSRTKDRVWADKAVRANEEALRIDPTRVPVLIGLAVAHQRTGRRDAAMAELRRAIGIQPTNDDAHRILATVLAEVGKPDEALAAYARAIALRPGFSGNHEALGRYLYQLGRFPDAIAALKKATELNPSGAGGFQALGTVYQVVGDLPNARANYQRALQLAPNALAYSNYGTASYWEGRYQEALDAYRRALELAPGDPFLHRNVGDAYQRLGDKDRARTSWGMAVSLAQQLLAVNPRSAETLSELAINEVKLGRVAEAQDHLTRARSLAPDSSDVWYAQAVVHALSGLTADALSALQTALTKGASAEIARRDDDLASIRSAPQWARLLGAPRQ